MITWSFVINNDFMFVHFICLQQIMDREQYAKCLLKVFNKCSYQKDYCLSRAIEVCKCMDDKTQEEKPKPKYRHELSY